MTRARFLSNRLPQRLNDSIEITPFPLLRTYWTAANQSDFQILVISPLNCLTANIFSVGSVGERTSLFRLCNAWSIRGILSVEADFLNVIQFNLNFT